MRRLLGGGLLASACALASAGPGAAQTLLDDLLPQPAGVCTCAVIEPPNDCGALLSEPRQLAQQQRRDVRAQCAMDWRDACEEQYGWQACSTTEARAQLADQCDSIAESWWAEVAQPQISAMRNQCDAANASWIEQCETVERPQNCATCTDMSGEIEELETRISQNESWITSMRSGAAVLTPDDETEITQRLDEIRQWQRELAEKREGYGMLQDSQFCPRS